MFDTCDAAVCVGLESKRLEVKYLHWNRQMSSPKCLIGHWTINSDPAACDLRTAKYNYSQGTVRLQKWGLHRNVVETVAIIRRLF